MATTLTEQMIFLDNMRKALMKDTDICRTNLTNAFNVFNSDSSKENMINVNFWCLTSVRVFFSAVEGVLHSYKVVMEKCYEAGEIEFSEDDLPIIRGEKWLSFHENLKFTVKHFSRLIGIPSPVNKNSQEWVAFKKITEIRNRITHPKKIEDVFITTEEIPFINQGPLWFWNLILKLIEGVDV